MAVALVPGDTVKVDSGKHKSSLGVVMEVDMKPESTDESYQVALLEKGTLVWFPDWQLTEVKKKDLPEEWEFVPGIVKAQLLGDITGEQYRDAVRERVESTREEVDEED